MTYITKFAARARLEPSRKRLSGRDSREVAQKNRIAELLIAQHALLIRTVRSLQGEPVTTKPKRAMPPDAAYRNADAPAFALEVAGEEMETLHVAEKGDTAYLSEVLGMTPENMANLILGDERFTRELVDLLAAKVAGKLAEKSDAAAPVDALSAARQRGAAYMRAQLGDPANLSLASAASKTGFSEKHINDMRNQDRYYALVAEGATRGFRYPEWQFDADVRRLEPVVQALGRKKLSGWAMHDFLVRPHADLARSPREAILDANFPVERITGAVEQRFMDADQGAA